MPAQLVLQQMGLQGIRVEYVKYYPFITKQWPDISLIDVFPVSPKVSGTYFLLLYFYAYPNTDYYYPTFYIFDQYYPPGSSNYPTNPTWYSNVVNGHLGAILSNSPLKNEIICQTSGSTNTCYYKYNTQYILYVLYEFAYVKPGTTAWVGIAPAIYPQSVASNILMFRAATAWEVY